MRPLINKRKNLKVNYIRKFLEVKRDFNSGSECDAGSENVIIEYTLLQSNHWL